MAASISIDGYGVSLKIATVALTNGEILDVNFSGQIKDVIDVSHAASPSHYREKMGGFKDASQCSITLNYTQADHILLMAEFEKGTLTSYTVTFPDINFGTTDPDWTFNAVVTNVSEAIPVEDKLTMELELDISGPRVFTAGTQV